MCANYTPENKGTKIEQLIINNELLNIIRRAAMTKSDFELAETVRIVLEISEAKNE